MKRSIFCLLGTVCLSAVLTACGGGGSDSSAPPTEPTNPSPPVDPTNPPPPAVKVGDFELVAGTLDVTAPAGAPRCQNGPALGADLGFIGYRATVAAFGSNGHIYWLSTDCTSLSLVEINPSTGQMQVQPVPYDPSPTGPALTKIYSPLAIAVASDGSVLIADQGMIKDLAPFTSSGSMVSIPAGIWRFKNGTLSKLAGFDRPVPVHRSGDWQFHTYLFPSSEDGKGGNATFSYELLELCAGQNDTFYVYEYPQQGWSGFFDFGSYRKVSLDGTVETIARFRYDDQFTCATNQRVFAGLVQNPDSSMVNFVDLVSGQIFGKNISTSWLKFNRYGFGNGLTVSRGGLYNRNDLSYWIITDLKSGAIKLGNWINGPCGNSFCYDRNRNPNPRFQLENMPYEMPMDDPDLIGIDDNNYAYIRSGNALLRYKLPGSLLSN
jgi:hypothetical protein